MQTSCQQREINYQITIVHKVVIKFHETTDFCNTFKVVNNCMYSKLHVYVIEYPKWKFYLKKPFNLLICRACRTIWKRTITFIKMCSEILFQHRMELKIMHLQYICFEKCFTWFLLHSPKPLVPNTSKIRQCLFSGIFSATSYQEKCLF